MGLFDKFLVLLGARSVIKTIEKRKWGDVKNYISLQTKYEKRYEKSIYSYSAFINKFDEHLAKNYFITGERGGAKKITLPRDLIIWE